MEIVDTLRPYIEGNSIEDKYQSAIENCLKYLGWRSSNKTMQSQVTINIGNNNSIRPDIVLYKNELPVLPIEIKRPGNTCNAKQQSQLKSYMRQLRLNIGLYIGENIQLYYDNPDDIDNPISVLNVEIQQSDVNGDIFCDLLSCLKFDIKNLEDFCKERYNQIVARNNLHRRLDEFFAVNNAVKNTMALIKEKFIKEGYDDEVLEDELHKLDLTVHWETNLPAPKNDTTPAVPDENIKRKDVFYSFDGVNYHSKRRFVLELIKYYVSQNVGITFGELEKQFPKELHTKALGVIKTLEFVIGRIATQQDVKKRYFLKENEIITLSDGTKVVVNNQWGGALFSKFLNKAQTIYQITIRYGKYGGKSVSSPRSPATMLKITFGDGSVIMESNSVSTFKSFVEKIGISQVASLNLPGRKDTPLIGKVRSDEYSRFQHPISNGYYLLLNHSTWALNKLVGEIASRLNIDANVEVVPKQNDEK